MSERKDCDLIEAIESNNLPLVQKALREGADPNARKRVTELAAGPYSPYQQPNYLAAFGQAGLLPQTVVPSQQYEIALAESALALAIIHASPTIVGTLIQAGADPIRPVEWTFKAKGNYSDPFAPNFGVPPRHLTFRWNSAIEFALAEGPVSVHRKDGKVASGEGLTLNLTPRVDVIAVLLRDAPGAINANLLTKAKQLHDERIASLIEKRLQGDYDTARGVVTPPPALPPRRADINGRVEELAAKLEQLTAKFSADTEKLEQRVRELENRNGELERQLQTMSVQLNSKLDQTTLARITRLEQQVTNLGVQQPSNHAQAAPPVDVKRLMHVVGDFTPCDADEIALSAGERVFCNFEYPDGWGSGFNTSTGGSGFFPMACLSDTPTLSPAPVSVGVRTSSVVAPLRTPPPSNPSAARAVPSTRAFADVRGPAP
ncbi:hypothetical protein M427DRAFT_73147 [Gonapodya prolifera JEL478]|uniref:SH3 domain-containing protein n=1 Tax=Gonapodya prolifera (strain JEL478) TaxID=1344416 RepID=A0A139A3I3_GONPJ|nr:hypothetical protein M427DRAFT_73147 [Gonapodya prolifera JEL478]|eukprot:KXS11178.1 hypothetical protein M427DRAFT_73147 [Gonapodya prolifera JEL478]